MAKGRRKKQGQNKKHRAESRAAGNVTSMRATSQETQTAEAMTVFWMLSALIAVSAQALGVLLQLFLRQQEKPEAWLLVSSRTLLLVSFLTGLLTLVLTPLVLRSRTVPPPRPIVIGAVVAGVMSLVTALW